MSADSQVIHREEVVAVMFMLADAVQALQDIRTLLEDDEEEDDG